MESEIKKLNSKSVARISALPELGNISSLQDKVATPVGKLSGKLLRKSIRKRRPKESSYPEVDPIRRYESYLRWRRLRFKRIFLAGFYFFITVFVITYLLAAYVIKGKEGEGIVPTPGELFRASWALISPDINLPGYFDGKDVITFLIVGVDGVSIPPRSDSVVVGKLNLENLETRLVSIPRDTLLDLYQMDERSGEIKRRGREHLYAAYFYGGMGVVRPTLEKFLGIPIDYYIKVDFDGFEKVIDYLGGIELEVEKRMKYKDKSQNLFIDLQPGFQRLNGDDALDYARFRHDSTGDIGRMSRQQKLINALLAEFKKSENVSKIPVVLKMILDNFETNLSLDKLTALKYILGKIQAENLKGMVLRSEAWWENGWTEEKVVNPETGEEEIKVNHGAYLGEKITSDSIREALSFISNLEPEADGEKLEEKESE